MTLFNYGQLMGGALGATGEATSARGLTRELDTNLPHREEDTTKDNNPPLRRGCRSFPMVPKQPNL